MSNTKQEILKKLGNKKTIKVFKIERWSSTGNTSDVFNTTPGWEQMAELFFTRKEAKDKIQQSNNFCSYLAPYDQFRITQITKNVKDIKVGT